MKKFLSLLLVILFLLAGCAPTTQPTPSVPCTHVDADDNGRCDLCATSVLIYVDLYAINDLHGKFCDTATQPGVDELTTFFKKSYAANDHTVLLSSGDMWQGSSESNLTKGALMTEWMNSIGIASMTLGNHEFDWGDTALDENLALADFPFLAINVYDKATNQLVSYCRPSVMVDLGDIQIGIIGAIGDCYGSIAGDKKENIYFQTGNALTALVKNESQALREAGADIIVYSLHDGFGQSSSGTKTISNADLSEYYDISLSGTYVDVVFEGHTHQRYVLKDSAGIYHLQGGGDNKGISHAVVAYNTAREACQVSSAEFLPESKYNTLADDNIVAQLLEKYKEPISLADTPLGYNDTQRDANFIRSLTARLYYEAGMEKWGKQYEIVLGGAYMTVRSPGYLAKGDITYGMLQTILPFDNTLALCAIKGRALKNHFFETNNKNYFLYYDTYGREVKNNIDPNKTYYVISDSYSYTYAPNEMTVVEVLDDTTFARDLLAAYIKQGGLTAEKPLTQDYTLTSIADAIDIGNRLAGGEETSKIYYIQGTILSVDNTKYGNMTIADAAGNSIYIYGMYDSAGEIRYDSLAKKPGIGDTVTVCGPIKKYVYASGDTKLELVNAKLIKTETP